MSVVVADNASTDGSADAVEARFPDAHVVRFADNIGLGAAVNRIVLSEGGEEAEWVLTLDSDVELDRDCISTLVEAALRDEKVWALCPQLRFAKSRGLINSAGIEVDRLGVAVDRHMGLPLAHSEETTTRVFGASTAAALIRRSAYASLGGIDESFFYPLEDVDLSWRAAMRGWKCLYVPEAVAYHHQSATVGLVSEMKLFNVGRNRVRLLAKNSERVGLLWNLPRIVLYDASYVVFAWVKYRSSAPARGRLRGMREWRAYRRAGAAGRRRVELARPLGIRRAVRRNRARSAAA